MILNNLLQTQDFRSSVCNRKHINAESIFQTGLLVKHVDEVLHIRIFLHFDHDADSFLGGLIGNVHDIIRLLCLDQVRHVI